MTHSEARGKKKKKKTLLELNHTHTKNHPIKKLAKGLNRHFSEEDIRMPTGTWEDAPHH